MADSNLDIAFQEAVQRVNEHTDPFPADILLKLYAFYKKATNNYKKPVSYTHLTLPTTDVGC